MFNLDDTKSLERIAAALEDLSRAKGREIALNQEILELSQSRDKGLDTIVEAYGKWGEAADRVARDPEKTEAAAEPAGVPVMLIVEVLIALIGILVRHVVADPVPATKLRELRKKLMPYQPVRPSGEEAE